MKRGKVLFVSLLFVLGLSAQVFAQAEAAPQEATAGAPTEAAPAPAPAETAPAPAEAAPAAQPEQQPAVQPAAQEEQKPKEEKGKCLLGEFCFGPALTLGIINPIGFGIQARINDMWGAAFDYQFMPSITVSSASGGWSAITVEGRFHPMSGTFFIALGFSYQMLKASISDEVDILGVPTKEKIEGTLGIPCIKLGLGWVSRSGFMLGFDISPMIPLSGTSVDIKENLSSIPGVDTEKVAKMKKDVKDFGDKTVGLIPVILQLNLIRIGYLF